MVKAQEIAISDMNWEQANQITKILIENGYVVLVSLEEQLIIINYLWSERKSDRNDVVFMSQDDFWTELEYDRM